MVKTGQRFVLSMDLLGIERVDGHCQTVTVPSGSVVEVVKQICPEDNRLSEILLDGRKVMVYPDDLSQMGKKVDHRLSVAGKRTNAAA